MMRFWAAVRSLAFAALCFAVFGAGGAYAAVCYSKAEAEAEQGIRIHSELMVIGLNCQHRTPKGQENYYYQYKKFTAAHGPTFAAYETALINYYKRAGEKDPVDQLNDLRTQLANKVSKDAATMRPDIFCAVYAKRIPKAAQMSDTQVRKWAATFYPGHPVSKPVCP